MLERAKANRQKGKKKTNVYLCAQLSSSFNRLPLTLNQHFASTFLELSRRWAGECVRGAYTSIILFSIPFVCWFRWQIESCSRNFISIRSSLLFFPLRSGLVHRVRFSNSGTGEKYALSQSHFVWHRFQYSKRRFDFAIRTLWIVSFFSVVLCQLFLAKIANAKWWRENTALVKRMKN